MAKIKLPDGRIGDIPDENLDKALAKGATVVDDSQEMSTVQLPDGRTGSIPKTNLDKALAKGAKLIAPQKEAPGQLEALGRGALQGGTLGFADEIAGAGEAGADALTGDVGSLEDLMKKYRQHRDESRANFKAASDAHPVTTAAGNLAGGILPALALAYPTGGGSLVAEAGLGAKLLQGAKTGAALGAVTGAGDSEADVTKGDVGGLAQDVAIGGGVGGALGGGLTAAGHGVGSLLNETKIGKNLSTAFNLGTEGESIGGLSNAKRIGQEAIDVPQDIAKEFNASTNKVGSDLAGSHAAFDEQGKKLNILDNIKSMRDKVSSLDDKGQDSIKEEKTQLLNYLDNILANKNEVSAKDLSAEVGSIRNDLSYDSPSVEHAKNDIARSFTQVLNENVPEESVFRAMYRDLKDASRLYTNSTDPTQASEDLRKGLTDAVYNLNGTSASAREKQDTFNQFISKVKATNPEMADKIEQQVQKLNEKVSASGASLDESTLQSAVMGIPKAVGTNIANAAGQTYGAVSNSAPAKLASGMYNQAGDFYKGIANKVATQGEVGKKLAGMLNSISEQDNKAKNATLFVIMQNPVYRQLMGFENHNR